MGDYDLCFVGDSGTGIRTVGQGEVNLSMEACRAAETQTRAGL